MQILWMVTPLALCLLIVCGLSWPSSSLAATNPNDANALLALQQAWSASTTLRWSGSDPCGSKWTGISCDQSSPQRVTNIILSGLQLAGTIPSDIQFLTALEYLDLSYNGLTGQLPSQFGQLQSLTNLILQGNQFTGQIPAELGQLKNLTYLYLNNNNLTGPLPHELGLLSNLYWLDAAYNQLTGSLPYSSDGLSSSNAGLDNLTQARHFHLNNNQFSGTIPTVMCHSGMTLIHLLLDSNKLTGTIPGQLGDCSALEIMRLSDNALIGGIPAEIGQLGNLTEIHVSQNQLDGVISDLTNLTNLVIMDASENKFSVDFPSWLPSLKSLTDLIMDNVKVNGQIPASLFAIPTLTTVKLGNNNISGSLNMSLGGSQITLVSLENNQIGTFVPQSSNYQPDIRLSGNPACDQGNYLSAKLCTTANTSQTVASYGVVSCPNNCSDPSYQPAPTDCTCELPYSGLFIFRAPKFTSLTNATYLDILVNATANLLRLNVTPSFQTNQIVIPSANFTDLNQLYVNIEIFPNTDSGTWSMADVIKMSNALGRIGIHLDAFGPPLFLQNAYSYSTAGSSSSGLGMGAKIGIGVGAAVLGIFIIVLLVIAFKQKRRADKAEEQKSPFVSWGGGGKDSGAAPQLQGARYFSYVELKKATNNFSETNEIGRGGYGKVYRGITSTGQQVAIKRADTNSMQGATEFKTEIELLSRVHHRNVVCLVGFCFDKGEQMLVYEYMAGGCLRDHLTGRTGMKLDWRRRIMIALGAARGITYLHELVNPPIIHRDIKSTNILLDEKKIAKVGDFGLSKVGIVEGDGKTHISTQVKGTLGYLDPEYYLSQQLTEKSDVYSYGVVMLELLTARMPIEHGKYIVKEMKEAFYKGGLSAVLPFLDPRIKDEADPEELNVYLRIAVACVNDSASSRPSMGEVVKKLEELIGQDYPESGSSNIEVVHGKSPRRLYSFNSDIEHNNTSRESSQPSFPNSGTDFIR